jgi:hypothetical protein
MPDRHARPAAVINDEDDDVRKRISARCIGRFKVNNTRRTEDRCIAFSLPDGLGEVQRGYFGSTSTGTAALTRRDSELQESVLMKPSPGGCTEDAAGVMSGHLGGE